MKRIYLDYASSTPVAEEVAKEIAGVSKKFFGNPSSLHAEGFAAKKVLDESRGKLARILQCGRDEIIFVSGGTEANNLAIRGVLSAFRKKNPTAKIHAITSIVEHSSVLATFKAEEKLGVSVTYLPVGRDGMIAGESVLKAITQDTAMVSLQYANNETGVILSVGKIARAVRRLKDSVKNVPVIHVDASAAAAYLNCSPETLAADLITFDAQKMYGPKGVGALYVRKDIPISPIISGGGQENNLRAGAVALPLVAGFAVAFGQAEERRAGEAARLSKLRAYLRQELQEKIGGIVFNESPGSRLPNILNFSLPGRDNQMLALRLDAKGFAVSTKSACEEGEKISHVVMAMTRDEKVASATFRVSLGRTTTRRDLSLFVKVLQKTLSKYMFDKFDT